MKRKFLLISLFLILVSCSPQIKYVEIDNIKIPVELAVTEQEKTKGLMFRANLTGGVLFIYDDEEVRNFWMKNTLIPLDIIFIDENNIITAIHRAIPCERDPCIVYPGTAKYVLEVNYNFTAENNITEGGEVKIY